MLEVLAVAVPWYVGAIVLAACGGGSDSERCIRTTAALQGGGVSPSVLALDARELRAIVRLEVMSEEGARRCTATLVAPGTLLTAAHCFTDTPDQITVRLDGERLTLTVENLHVADARDLAVVEVTTAVKLDSVAPVQVATELRAWRTGEVVQIAGYSDWDAIDEPVAFAAEEVVAIDDSTLSVSGFGFSGACGGDSGGPLLTRAEDGRVRIAAVLSVGHSSCRAEDRYIRLDSALLWLESLGIHGRVSQPPACDDISPEGRCYGDLAVFCDSGALRATPCVAPDTCGWSEAQRGYRCVASGSDPCRGVGDLGVCEDGMALRCIDGTIEQSQCAACGGECVRSPKTGRATCF